MEVATAEQPITRPPMRAPPVDYSDELADRICLAIAQGQSMRQLCKAEGMPDPMSVYRWLRDKPDFTLQYEASREMAAEAFANEVIELADAECPVDTKGRMDSGFVQRQRLRVDTRKWVASKLLPKVYGDKLDVAHSGSVSITRTDFVQREPIDGQSERVAAQQLTPIAVKPV